MSIFVIFYLFCRVFLLQIHFGYGIARIRNDFYLLKVSDPTGSSSGSTTLRKSCSTRPATFNTKLQMACFKTSVVDLDIRIQESQNVKENRNKGKIIMLWKAGRFIELSGRISTVNYYIIGHKKSGSGSCCGSGMILPDPGSEFWSRVTMIPDPGSGSALNKLSILTQKIVSKLSEKWPGMFIPDPGSRSRFFPARIPDLDAGSRDTGSGSATLLNPNRTQEKQRMRSRLNTVLLQTVIPVAKFQRTRLWCIQRFGSGSRLDQDSIWSVNPNTDPCRQKRPTKKEKSEEFSFFEE